MIMEASLYTNIFIALLCLTQTVSFGLIYILNNKVATLEEQRLLDILKVYGIAEETKV